MKYFCVDESGSYNSNYERYYIISGIIVEDTIALSDIHKKIEAMIRKRKTSNKELKAAKIKDSQKAMFINEMIDKKMLIVSLAIDKVMLRKEYDFIMSEFLIYNYALKELTKFALNNGYINLNDSIIFNVDARTMNPKIFFDLESYLNLEFFNVFKYVRVQYKDSAKNREIQMADYISNTVYGYLNKTNQAFKHLHNARHIKLKVFPSEKGVL